ncbi:MAG: hypothetical protein JO048_02085 [Methylobacteriaceae bacterium]|nr:hypothetical protein [Methylobacteriaceae bacterium]
MTEEQAAGPRPRSLVVTTVKAVLAVGLLSYAAASWLTGGFDQQHLSRLAFQVSRDVPDPVTTGSISDRARRTVLDPCAAPTRRP